MMCTTQLPTVVGGATPYKAHPAASFRWNIAQYNTLYLIFAVKRHMLRVAPRDIHLCSSSRSFAFLRPCIFPANPRGSCVLRCAEMLEKIQVGDRRPCCFWNRLQPRRFTFRGPTYIICSNPSVIISPQSIYMGDVHVLLSFADNILCPPRPPPPSIQPAFSPIRRAFIRRAFPPRSGHGDGCPLQREVEIDCAAACARAGS